MRKLLFAVVLVSASFAGGAVANGPGFHRVQAMIYDKLGIEGEEGDEVGKSAAAGSNPSTSSSTSEEIPSRPIPPLVVEPVAADKGKADPAVVVAAAPSRASAKTSHPESSEPPFPPAPIQDALPPTASILPALNPVPEAPPTPDPIPPLSASAQPSESETPRPTVAAEETKSVDKVRDDHGVDPSVRRVSADGDADPAAPADWTAVRETMRELGVSRYGIDGDPSGRVRFHCVIPLAGRRAVGQHFEAEGDDDLQAARAALKRVALWKATEGGESGNP